MNIDPKQETRKTASQRAAELQLVEPQEEPKAPKGPKPMSVEGFGENLLNNLWDIAKGFVNVFPTAIKSGAQVFGDPAGLKLLAENPEHLVTAFRNTASALGQSIVEPYQKHGLRVMYEEPMTPVLDAMTILSLGGGAIAKAGRLAQSEKMVEMGSKIASLPERIAGKMIEAPMRAIGINPEMRQMFLRNRRQVQSDARMNANSWGQAILAGSEKYTPAELQKAYDFAINGATKEDYLANPRAAELHQKVEGWLKNEREAELGGKQRALLTDEQMQGRVIKAYAESKGMDFKTAKAAYEGLDVKPLYVPALKETAEGMTWENALTSPSVIKTGKVGFLERFESNLGASKDIRKLISRSIDAFYQSRANMRLIDQIIQTPGVAKVAGRGEVPLKELLPSKGILQKYYGDPRKAQSLFVSELEQTHGKERAAQLLATDPATQRLRAKAVNITIADPTLRNLIRREFTRAGGEWGAFLRIYDRVTQMFKFSATKLSPRWYTGNIVGDALLASLAGSNWSLAKRLIESEGLPAAMRSGSYAQALESGNRLNFLSDIVGAVDDTARAAVFSKAVVAKLRSTVLQFSASEEMFSRAVREVALAPDQLADLMVKNQLLGEHVARNSSAIQKLDTEIVKTRKALNDSLGEETKRQARMMEPAVKGKPIDLEKAGGTTLGERDKLQAALDRGKLTFNERRQVTDRLREIERGPEIGLQKGEAVALGKRKTPPSEQLQTKLDMLMETRDSAVADLKKNMMAREIQKVPELAAKAKIAEEAMDRANTFLGEYLGLGPIERGVFRRLVPFYPWMKAMAKLAFTFPFIAPGKAFFWHRYASAMTELMGDPDLPDWLAPYAAVFVRQNGDYVWARFSSLSPFGSLRTEHLGGIPIPSIMAFWQANPWVSLGFRLIGGKDTFSPSSLPYGEHLVAINDGEVWKFNERGKLEKVIAQPPLIRTGAHSFPVVQMIDQLISNYDVRKGKPVLNSDGTVKYPIELPYRLADAFGLKLMDRNREQAIRMEKLTVRKTLLELKKDYKRADPEERQYIKGVFEDYARGEYRRIEATR